MLQTTEQIPINNLPTISGVISKIHHCTPAKGGWINRVEVLTSSGAEASVYTPCLANFYSENSILGKPILSINEKFNFPTIEKERRILLVINNIVFEALPKYRSASIKDKSIILLFEIGKFPAMLFAAILIFLLFAYAKFKKLALRGLDKINELRINAENAFSEKCNAAKIISRVENFNTTPKYEPPLYLLDIYYRSLDGLYWRFKSDGVSHKTTHIPDEIARIKWPDLPLS